MKHTHSPQGGEISASPRWVKCKAVAIAILRKLYQIEELWFSTSLL
ncbi:hypothetical protein PN499_21180 [Kamptonema animale CS-326]|nr:hypothetical protein [Kamptonema animale]MDB9513713.1 hypothetical protein [Kamptonema animale CS-326]